MLIIQGAIRLSPADADKLEPAAIEMVQATVSQEPGCIVYAFARDLSDPGLFHIIERWQDQAALDAHFATAHMAKFQAAMAQVTMLGGTAKQFDATLTKTLMGE